MPEWEPIKTVGGAKTFLTTSGEASTHRPMLKLHLMFIQTLRLQLFVSVSSNWTHRAVRDSLWNIIMM